MAHQPFDNWLLDPESLTRNQRLELETHLLTCAECQQLNAAWAGVTDLIKSVPQVAPAPGFTHRWQKLQLERRTREQPRQVRLFFMALLAASLASIALLGLFFVINHLTISQVLVSGAHFFTGFYSIWVQAQFFISARLNGPAATAIWVLVSSGICIMVIVWIVTVLRITSQGVTNHERN